MSTHYFYSILNQEILENMVTQHQKDFNDFLEDNFSEQELIIFEKYTENIAPVYVQSIIPELRFDDFDVDPQQEVKQKFFFESCQSSLCIENLPFFENNPFQVSYLQMLLKELDEFLVDQGEGKTLAFKEAYLLKLSKYKNLDQLISIPKQVLQAKSKPNVPVYPVDFLVLDVYKEIKRLHHFNHQELPTKSQKIFLIMKTHTLDAQSILIESKLNPKDFEDNLEKLKFILKKLS